MTIHLETSVHASNLTCRPTERRHYGLIELDTESKDGASGDCDAYAEKKGFPASWFTSWLCGRSVFPLAPPLSSTRGKVYKYKTSVEQFTIERVEVTLFAVRGVLSVLQTFTSGLRAKFEARLSSLAVSGF